MTPRSSQPAEDLHFNPQRQTGKQDLPRNDFDVDRLYAAVVRSVSDAIVTKTLDGTITGWNRAAERLFGYSAGEAIGQPIDIIMPPERNDEIAHDAASLRLVRLDVNVPRVGGLEVLTKIKVLEARRHIRVVVLTSSKSADDIASPNQLGANWGRLFCLRSRPTEGMRG